MAQYPIESIGNPKVGDVVRMKVESIDDGVATLTFAEADDNMKPEPSAINDMSKAFNEAEDEG